MSSLTRALVIAAALSAAGAAHADTIKIGAPLVMSGPFGSVGKSALEGLQMAVDDINAAGGLLGSQIEVVAADDAGKPATANTVTKAMILNDGVKALFPGSNSAAAVAVEALAGQYEVPALYYSAADISITTTNFNKYAFQLSASTYMDPRAIARYLAKNDFTKVFTLTPDYNFGHSYVTNFLAGMKEAGLTPNVVGEQYPAIGTTDFSSYISAIVAAEPEFVFVGLFGGDLMTFIRQAKGYGLFEKTHVGAPNATDVLETLKGDAPAGMYLWARAPFFSMDRYPEVQKLAARYHDKIGAWPPEWPILAYTAVQIWADAVRRAGTFDAGPVAEALVDHATDTIRGPVAIRDCDHQADAQTYIGRIAATVDERYGFPLLEDLSVIDGGDVRMACDEAVSLQRK